MVIASNGPLTRRPFATGVVRHDFDPVLAMRGQRGVAILIVNRVAEIVYQHTPARTKRSASHGEQADPAADIAYRNIRQLPGRTHQTNMECYPLDVG